MTDNNQNTIEESAVGDVRRIRQRFSREAGGDLRQHFEQTLQAFEELSKSLDLRIVSPPDEKPTRVR